MSIIYDNLIHLYAFVGFLTVCGSTLKYILSVILVFTLPLNLYHDALIMAYN
jgi:hypothetical protein